MKLLKLNLICIINCTTSEKRTEVWTIDFFSKFLNFKNEFSRKEESSVPIVWSLRFLRTLGFLRPLRQFHYVPYVRCVSWKPRFTRRVASCNLLNANCY